MAPPRKRSTTPLLVLLALFVLGVVVVGVIFYESDYKPRHYLQQWAAQIGTPRGRFQGGVQYGDNHVITLQFSEECNASSPCDPTPTKALLEWVNNDGGGVDDQTLTNCFRYGDSFSYDHGRHPVTIECQQVDSIQLKFTFTARLGY
jgi:hypothetical protein